MSMKRGSVCKRCAFTGYRPQKMPWGEDENHPLCVAFKARLRRALESLIGEGYVTFLSGCARGFDTMAAEAVLELREAYPWVRLVMASPWDGQANRWSDADKLRRARLFEQADEVVHVSHVYSREVYFRRNAWMIGHCDLLLAAFDGQPGGTAMTVEYARAHGVKVARLRPTRETQRPTV